MKKNIGNLDKVIRILIAIVIIILNYTKVVSGLWAVITIIFAVILLLTTLFSFCPLYWPFGIKTIGKTDTKTKK